MTIDYHELTEYREFDGERWLWPKDDVKLAQVNDWVGDLNSVLLAMTVRDRMCGVAIQAGGACGVWPKKLAANFDVVYTFEPNPVNFWCLVANCGTEAGTIKWVQAALGENFGSVDTVLPPSEKGNAGAYYTMDHAPGIGESTCPRVTIDSLELWRCDLICLDVEGREVEALRGANQTIKMYKPFIMIEEKPLPQMGHGMPVPHTAGAAREWMEVMHGYTVVDRVHKDVIMAPPLGEE